MNTCEAALPLFSFVGLPGIDFLLENPAELGLLAPFNSLFYIKTLIQPVGLPGIEPGLHAPHACVLPVYYSPYGSTLI